MNQNKEIIKKCNNFYKIMNFNYYEDDYISQKLISIYQDYLFSIDPKNKKDMDNAIELDKIISRYIDDYTFRKEMKNGFINIKVKQDENIINSIISSIINIFNKYEEGYTRNIYFSRWI